MKELLKAGTGANLMVTMMAGLEKKTAHLLLNPFRGDLDLADEKVWEVNPALKNFVRRLQPVAVHAENVQKIQESDFDETMGQMENTIHQLEQDKLAMSKQMENDEKVFATMMLKIQKQEDQQKKKFVEKK